MPKGPGEMAVRIERLVETYSDTLLRVALHNTQNISDAEDVVQTVFLKLLRLGTQFADAEHEKAWLIRVTINQCRDLKRSAWHKKTTGFAQAHTALPARGEEQGFEVLQVVRQLPDGYANIVYLYYFEGYSTLEIANMLNMNQNTVESRLHRARAKLRALLKGEWD